MSAGNDSHDGTPTDRARPDDVARRRRRRRRRRGEGSGPATGKGEAAPTSGAIPGSRASADSGPSADSTAESPSPVSRGPESRGPESRGPESRGPESRGPESRAAESRGADAQGADARGGESRRRRRRRRARDGGGARPEPAPRPAAGDDEGTAESEAAAEASAEPRDDDFLPSGERDRGRPRARERGRDRPADEARAEAWGDDSAAPTAEVALAADLPADPPVDEPDPVSAALDDEADPPAPAGPVRNLIGIKFTTAGKIYLFDAGDDKYQVGDEVVVETERGPGIGRVAVAPLRQEVTRTGPLRRVLRRPGRSDQRRIETNRERAEAAMRAAKACARELGLPTKIFRAELSLGGGKALVYFSSDEKVDVRRLMRELSQRLHLRIELRQTGVRDEAKMVGGIGSCGQELCCTTWLPAFVPVSIKNAKDQGLVLNPTKVSGQCGRLKCCLVYEQATYAELRRGLPKLGKRVITDSGEGRVIEVDVLRQRVRVSLVGGEVEIFEASDVRPMFPSQPGSRPPNDPPG